MAQLETARYETQAVHRGPRMSAALRTRVTTRIAMLAGALVAVSVGVTMMVTPGLTLTAVGVLLGIQLAVQGAVQLLTVREAKVPQPVRWLLAAGALAVLFLASAFFRGHADSVFLLGLWIGFGWLLRGFTMAVSMIPSSIRHVFVYDDLLNAVVVSAGLFVTAFPFSSLGQLTTVVGSVLVSVGSVEAMSAFRRRPQSLRSFD
ncbi:DUF308 domain-containing protein [Streptomyces sp. S.PB5]|uniref:DUF308 domain-containing protein n=1 Tax=Streptomyces sp. S.PB5 TaxID=3020844 RepID=UPI0025B258C7|nr:DUF308 domain-containing protein [Streptomyces sp. S.PB5]MDN3029765.1 DUF308 domain-containing protein [Streptomyces sp. S.PB5]